MSGKQNKYRFSVVIPCFNEANYIASTLKSLKNQDTTAKFEVIVVDNNCTDETAQIAQSYGAKVVKEKIPGICTARNRGTLVAKGEIVISTDADTTFHKSWLRRIDTHLENDKALVAIGGPCRYADGPWWGKVFTHFVFGFSTFYSKVTGHPFYWTATNIAFKKSEWSGYNLAMMQGGDELDLLHRLREKGRVKFDNSNSVYTSGRRLENGLFYNVFVSFLFYYVCAYYLDRIFNRSIIGVAPAFRGTLISQEKSRLAGWSTLFSLAIISIFVINSHARNFVIDNVYDSGTLVKNTVKLISVSTLIEL